MFTTWITFQHAGTSFSTIVTQTGWIFFVAFKLTTVIDLQNSDSEKCPSECKSGNPVLRSISYLCLGHCPIKKKISRQVKKNCSIMWITLILIFLSLQASGKMDPCRFVAVTSTTAAKVFNIYPKKVNELPFMCCSSAYSGCSICNRRAILA